MTIANGISIQSSGTRVSASCLTTWPDDVELRARDRAQVVVEEADLEDAGVDAPLDAVERLLVRRPLEDVEREHREHDAERHQAPERRQPLERAQQEIEDRGEEAIDRA